MARGAGARIAGRSPGSAAQGSLLVAFVEVEVTLQTFPVWFPG
jgi:hypothetical protein